MRNPQFTKLDDVLDSDLNLGVMAGGSTYNFFENSQDEQFRKAWVKMNKDKENFASSTANAANRIAEGGYAYILEFPYVDYIVNSNCTSVMVGRKLLPGGHAFAFQKGSEYKAKFDKVIEEMSRSGQLEKYHAKWWHGDKKCYWTQVTGEFYADSTNIEKF